MTAKRENPSLLIDLLLKESIFTTFKKRTNVKLSL